MKHEKIRASMAHKCRKCLTDYLVNGKQEVEAGGASLMGTLIHDGFVPYYEKKIGMRIVDREKAIENEQFTGHIDGFIKKTKTVFELKTVNSFIFAKLVEPKIEHIQQVHIYMNILKARKAHIVYVDRDTGNHMAFEIEYQPIMYKALEAKAIMCQMDAKLGLYGDAITLHDFESCDAYCEFDTAKAIQVLPEGEKLSSELDNKLELEILIQEYQELSAQEKEAQANKAHISNQVKEILISKGIRKIPDMKLQIVQQNRTMLDADAIKKHHPDIYNQYLKTNVSQFVRFPTAV